MFLGPTSNAAVNKSANYYFSLCFLNPQELNTGFVDDKTNSKSFTFERSAGLCGIVSTEEQTTRLKTGPSRRRLIFHPELSQFCHFLRNKKNPTQFTTKLFGLLVLNSSHNKPVSSHVRWHVKQDKCIQLKFYKFQKYFQISTQKHHQNVHSDILRIKLWLTGEDAGGVSSLSGGEWNFAKASPYAMV